MAILMVTLFLVFSFTISEKASLLISKLIPLLPREPPSYCADFPNYIQGKYNWVAPDAWQGDDCESDHLATLGRVLFYDKSLSRNGSLSCGSCHKQEYSFADNGKISEGIKGPISQHTPSLNDLGWHNKTDDPTIRYMWKGSEDDLREMVLKPFVNDFEMDNSLFQIITTIGQLEYYKPLFKNAFGDETIGTDKIGLALAHFIETMVVLDTKYDRVKEGQESFTEAEKKGEIVFNKHCNVCHTAPSFGLFEPLMNGFPGDNGPNSISVSSRSFKTPSLRNIAITAPYMHNGGFEDLDRVLRYYSDSLVFPITTPVYYGPGGGTVMTAAPMHLKPSEIANLKAFLLTLTGSNLLTDRRWSDPFVEAEGEVINRDNPLVIYPNPINETAILSLKDMPGAGFNIELFNTAGVRVFHEKTDKRSYELKRSGLPAGVYMLKVKSHEGAFTKPIVFQ